MVDVAHDQRADVTLQQYCNSSSKHKCVRVIGTDLLVHKAKGLVIPFIQQRKNVIHGTNTINNILVINA